MIKTALVSFLLVLSVQSRVFGVDLPSTIRVGKWNGAGYDVYTLSLEQYLRGVAHHEMSFLRHVEAYKCQTVAARCYAAANIGKHASQGFDVCNQTCCQRWEPDYDGMTDQSVSGTTGEVITCPGWGIITAWYSSHCDGRTRSSQEVWGGYRPWALSVSCPCGWSTMLGHGVGMCQYGAKKMADQGHGYRTILMHYYSNSVIESGTSPPSAPNPSIKWLDQGLNSGNTQKVKVTCALPANATKLYYDMSGAGCNDYEWTGNTTYTDTGVHDSQTVSVRCKAKGPGGESGWSSWKSVTIKDRTPPSPPSPGTPVWHDQGLNSRDTQEVESAIPLPPPDATQVWHRLMSGVAVLADSGWTANTVWTFIGVGDEQWVKVNARARDAEGNYTSWVASPETWIKDRTPPGPPTITRDWPGILRQEVEEPSINPYRLKGTKTEDTAAIWLNGQEAEADFPTATGWEAYFVIYDQDNPVSAVAKDEEGNYSEELVEETIRVEIKEWFVDGSVADREDGFPLDGFTPGTAYRKIGEANAWADSWDEINVAAGIYSEKVGMVANTAIKGAGRGETVIEGPGWGSVVTASSGGSLEGFTVRGSGRMAGDFGVFCPGLIWFTLKNCTMEGNFDGVGVTGGSNVAVENDVIANNLRYGVVLTGSETRVENNTVDSNGLAGVFCRDSGKSEVKNNIITNNHLGIEVFSGPPRISYNNVWNNRAGDYKNCSPGACDISIDPKFAGN